MVRQNISDISWSGDSAKYRGVFFPSVSKVLRTCVGFMEEGIYFRLAIRAVSYVRYYPIFVGNVISILIMVTPCVTCIYASKRINGEVPPHSRVSFISTSIAHMNINVDTYEAMLEIVVRVPNLKVIMSSTKMKSGARQGSRPTA